MSNSLFDPKMYKHVSSDKDKTVLRHKSGHQITLAHNALSPKMRTALEALSKLPQQSATSNQAQESQDQAQYGKVIMKADGGKINHSVPTGYSLKHHTPIVETYPKKHPQAGQPRVTSHKITAHDESGAQVGHYEFSIPHTEHEKNNIYVDASGTAKEHQRKGLASSAYRAVQEKYPGRKLVATTAEGSQTEDAKALWKAKKFAEGGEIEPKTFLGQPVYGTGRSQPKAPAHEGSTPAEHEEEWTTQQSTPYPGSYQDTHRDTMAKGGKIPRYADGTDNVQAPPTLRAPDNYGGGTFFSKGTTEDADTGQEFSQSENTAKESIPQEINRNSNEIISQGPPGIGNGLQDFANVRKVVPRIAEIAPEQKEIMKVYNTMLTGGGTNVIPENMLFNENTGAPPAHVDMTHLQNAKTVAEYTARRDADALKQNQAKVQQENQLRQASGLMPEPVPQAKGYEGLPGFENAHGIDDGSQHAGQEYNPYDYMPAQEGPAGPKQTQDENSMTGDPGTDYATGVSQQLQGLQSREQADQQIGAGRLAAGQRYDDAIQTANALTQQEWQQNDREHQAIVREIAEGKIDPAKFWTGDKNGNGSHSKILSTIGLILGGIGAGWSGGPNYALQNLHYQMSQNLEGQKANLGKEQNLLASNLHHFGNINDAMASSRITQNMVLANDLEKAAASATNPAAKAALLQNAGQLRRDTAPMAMTFAMQRAMMNLNGGKAGDQPAQSPEAIAHMITQMTAINPEKARLYQQAFVPGVGLSKSLQPIPENIRNQIGAYNTSLDQIQQAIDFKQTHPGASFSPQDRATAQTLMTNIGNQVRVAEDMGVFKQSEATMMKTLLGNSPASFFSGVSTDPKLREMLRLKQQEQANLHKTWDLPPPKTAQPAPTTQTTIRVTPDGRKAIFNTATKQFLGYQK